MKLKIFAAVLLFAFAGYCGTLIFDSGLFKDCSDDGCSLVTLAAEDGQAADQNLQAQADQDQTPTQQGDAATDEQSDDNAAENGNQQVLKAGQALPPLQAIGTGAAITRELGSLDPASGYKFQIQLTSRGAAIATATLSEFDDRNAQEPQPLRLIEPVETKRGTQFTLGNRLMIDYGDRSFPLDRLNWQAGEVKVNEDGSQQVSFQAVVGTGVKQQGDATQVEKPLLKITKTYTVLPGLYHLECDVQLENLADVPYRAQLIAQGPTGVPEEAVRMDMRNIFAAYVTPDGNIESIQKQKKDIEKWVEKGAIDKLSLAAEEGVNFLWAGATNKYFAAILRPVPEGEGLVVPSAQGGTAQYTFEKADAQDPGGEFVSFDMYSNTNDIAPQSSERIKYQLYVGPKDKDIFNENPLYQALGFYHTISFRTCCCPQSMISPLSFGIMWLMKTMYNLMGPLGNYGIVIIIFVAMVRLLLHPITKKSQVSMMKMQKLAPKMEELKKKYGDNKQELQKRTMEMYREMGVSPISGMLPMFLQMPIWIALYSAIYANIELRGANFLPFWITDLSAPDALMHLPTITIPILGAEITSFNLLPILLGVAMFMQQKMMPQSANKAVNPQVAQQQKMMLWMMPIMMLIFLYKAPSGLNLYIMTSVFAGVWEQKVIRRHIKERDELEAQGKVPVTSKTGGKVKKKKPKPWIKH